MNGIPFEKCLRRSEFNPAVAAMLDFFRVTSAIARQIQVPVFTKQLGSRSEIAVKEKKEGKKNYLPQTLEIFRERSTKLFILSFSFYHDDQPSGSAVSFVLEELGRIRLDERDATKDPTGEEKTARPIGKFYERGGLLVSLASSANTRKVDIRTIKRSVSL